ncbi:hypothetical protein DEO72_LG8g1736 [Vigna unguiculata]|uniref:Uncharacterized protein n=1 Tax=Vigna unguiculata TaxID=3917 RepID=A0A4D6MSU8_VIGUN|nr:hypothetical protein DEO72_LG8g1736 [Vigna unguiculata]
MANDGRKRTSRGIPIVPNIPRRPLSETDFGFQTIVDEKLVTKLRSAQPRQRDFGSETIVDEKLASKDRSGQPRRRDFGFQTIVDEKLASKGRSGQPRRRDFGSKTIVDEKLASKGRSGQPRWRDFGSETIDNKKLEPQMKKTQVKESIGSWALQQLITFVVFLFWMTMILNSLKVRFQGRTPPEDPL